MFGLDKLFSGITNILKSVTPLVSMLANFFPPLAMVSKFLPMVTKLLGGLGGNASESEGGMSLFNGLLGKSKNAKDVADVAKSVMPAIGGASNQSPNGFNNLFQSLAFNQAKVS
jgi:hypothetical protein